MKKKFQKLSKIVFVAGIIALIALVLIAFGGETITNQTVDGIFAVLVFLCLGICVLTIIFTVINFILAFIDGMKHDKKTFLKRFIVQFFLMVFIYVFLHVTSDVEKEFRIVDILIRSLAMSVGIIGGEYMISPPKDEEE